MDLTEQRWRERAACQDAPTEWFFPEDPQRPNAYNEGRKVCNICPVSDACLNYALDMEEEFGLWGGMSPYQRQRYVRLMNRHGKNPKAT